VKREISCHLRAIRENVIDLLPEEELVVKLEGCLKKRQPLKLKVGFDPTAKDLHLGHTVLLRKLRKLQDLGHFVYFIIGDFTAKIGDPSARKTFRPILTNKEIIENASTYTRQAFKILDKKKTQVIYNSVWYKKMNVSKFLSLLSSYTVARMLEREDFSQRMKENRPLTILEFVYPIIQGYDSVMIQADVEFGGSDQKFNLIVGRHLQEVFGQKPQVIVTLPLLVGLDGKNKMSKSLGNYVGITEEPKSMFGKLMSISDEVMWEYFRLLTDYKLKKVKKMHPKEAKLLLAESIVSFYYSPKVGRREKEEFEKVFSQKKVPEDIRVYKVKSYSLNLIDTIYTAGLVPSKNQGRRLLQQGGITLIDTKNYSQVAVAGEAMIKLPSKGIILKVGKKNFLKIILQK
jgi:tyrosyl-tRNA synthetase